MVTFERLAINFRPMAIPFLRVTLMGQGQFNDKTCMIGRKGQQIAAFYIAQQLPLGILKIKLPLLAPT